MKIIKCFKIAVTPIFHISFQHLLGYSVQDSSAFKAPNPI